MCLCPWVYKYWLVCIKWKVCHTNVHFTNGIMHTLSHYDPYETVCEVVFVTSCFPTNKITNRSYDNSNILCWREHKSKVYNIRNLLEALNSSLSRFHSGGRIFWVRLLEEYAVILSSSLLARTFIQFPTLLQKWGWP